MAHYFNLAEDYYSISRLIDLAVKNNLAFCVDEPPVSITFSPKHFGSGDYYTRLGSAQQQYIDYLKSDLDVGYQRYNAEVERFLEVERTAKFFPEGAKDFTMSLVKGYFVLTYPLFYFKTFHTGLLEIVSKAERDLFDVATRKIALKKGQQLLEDRLKVEAGKPDEKTVSQLVVNQKELVYLMSRKLDTFRKESELTWELYHMFYPESE